MGPCFALLLGCWADKSGNVRLILLCTTTVGCWAQGTHQHTVQGAGKMQSTMREAEAGGFQSLLANHTEEQRISAPQACNEAGARGSQTPWTSRHRWFLGSWDLS